VEYVVEVVNGEVKTQSPCKNLAKNSIFHSLLSALVLFRRFSSFPQNVPRFTLFYFFRRQQMAVAARAHQRFSTKQE